MIEFLGGRYEHGSILNKKVIKIPAMLILARLIIAETLHLSTFSKQKLLNTQ